MDNETNEEVRQSTVDTLVVEIMGAMRTKDIATDADLRAAIKRGLAQNSGILNHSDAEWRAAVDVVTKPRLFALQHGGVSILSKTPFATEPASTKYPARIFIVPDAEKHS